MSRPPSSTYRLQLRPGFGFAEATAVLPYLQRLGAGAVYLSPILQAAPGSTHGYDVVDHSRINEELGGAAGFRAFSDAATVLGMGVVVDVVPNHVAVTTPVSLNAPLWSLLREGPDSPFASWFDVDWSVPNHALLMPVLGDLVGSCLDRGEITVEREGPEPVVRYFDHVLPVRPGTSGLPLDELLDQQWYRLAYWRVADEELNYRRFFDVDTLAAVRVEDPDVFAETHAVLVALVAEGRVHGLRIDHPDGLADPGRYLDDLARATDDAWVVVEKILEGDEELPAEWRCAGTTGYDTLLRVGGVLVDPEGGAPLVRTFVEFTGEPDDFGVVVDASKRHVVERSLYAEVHRLVELLARICHADIRLRDHTRRALHECVVELLVAFRVYRAYVVPGVEADAEAAEHVEAAAAAARSRLDPERHQTLDLVVDLVLGRRGRGRERDELVVRFQQTCGPVMAKGVEDTAFYRWFPLSSLCEVGGEPDRIGLTVDELHTWAARQARTRPDGMTTMSTHDTKRAEDVRARLAVLAEVPDVWARRLEAWSALADPYRREAGPDRTTEYLVWQTIVGAFPIDADRLVPYLEKATREAKRRTSWTDPDVDFDEAVAAFATSVLADPAIGAAVAELVDELAPAFRENVLAAKLLALTLPGVPDVYQGCESVVLSLVDPDNRRPVDFTALDARLAALDGRASGLPAGLADEKLLVTARALRLRARQPAAFADSYTPLPVDGPHALAYLRGGDVAVVVPRLPRRRVATGGWGDAGVRLPAGSWTDVLSGARHDGGTALLGDLLARLPVALLVRDG